MDLLEAGSSMLFCVLCTLLGGEDRQCSLLDKLHHGVSSLALRWWVFVFYQRWECNLNRLPGWWVAEHRLLSVILDHDWSSVYLGTICSGLFSFNSSSSERMVVWSIHRNASRSSPNLQFPDHDRSGNLWFSSVDCSRDHFQKASMGLLLCALFGKNSIFRIKSFPH